MYNVCIFQTFGNHEFDNGVSGLVPFLDNITFPVINCNIDTSREPRLQGRFNKSVILDVNGEKVGVVGYITDETSFLSNPGLYVFEVKIKYRINLKKNSD